MGAARPIVSRHSDKGSDGKGASVWSSVTRSPSSFRPFSWRRSRRRLTPHNGGRPAAIVGLRRARRLLCDTRGRENYAGIYIRVWVRGSILELWKEVGFLLIFFVVGRWRWSMSDMRALFPPEFLMVACFSKIMMMASKMMKMTCKMMIH